MENKPQLNAEKILDINSSCGQKHDSNRMMILF